MVVLQQQSESLSQPSNPKLEITASFPQTIYTNPVIPPWRPRRPLLSRLSDGSGRFVGRLFPGWVTSLMGEGDGMREIWGMVTASKPTIRGWKLPQNFVTQSSSASSSVLPSGLPVSMSTVSLEEAVSQEQKRLEQDSKSKISIRPGEVLITDSKDEEDTTGMKRLYGLGHNPRFLFGVDGRREYELDHPSGSQLKFWDKSNLVEEIRNLEGKGESSEKPSWSGDQLDLCNTKVQRVHASDHRSRKEERRKTWHGEMNDLNLTSKPNGRDSARQQTMKPAISYHPETDPISISPKIPPPPEAPLQTHLKFHQTYLHHLFVLWELFNLLQKTIYEYNHIAMSLLSAVSLPHEVGLGFERMMDKWWLTESRWIIEARRRVAIKWRENVARWIWCFERLGLGDGEEEICKSLRDVVKSFRKSAGDLVNSMNGVGGQTIGKADEETYQPRNRSVSENGYGYGKRKGKDEVPPRWLTRLVDVPFDYQSLEEEVWKLESDGRMGLGSLRRLQNLRRRSLVHLTTTTSMSTEPDRKHEPVGRPSAKNDIQSDPVRGERGKKGETMIDSDRNSYLPLATAVEHRYRQRDILVKTRKKPRYPTTYSGRVLPIVIEEEMIVKG